MKFTALKDVTVNGRNYKAGSEIELPKEASARLVMLGYIEEAETTTNRAVGLDNESKPKTRAKRTTKK